MTVTINGSNDVIYTVNDTVDPSATKLGAGTQLHVGSGIPANGFGLANQTDVGVELGFQIIYRQGPVVLSGDDYSDGKLEFTVNDGPQSVENGSFANNAARAAWNFNYSIATGLDGNPGNLDGYTFKLLYDIDPTAATSYRTLILEPGGTGTSAHQWRDQGSGLVFIADDAGNANVTQNSENYAFSFFQTFLTSAYGLSNNFDGPAQFDLVLEAHRSGQLLADNHVVVNVVESNDAPVAQNDAAAVQEDVTASASGNVLANDLDNDVGDAKTVTEVNGAAVNVGAVIDTAYGEITINADGSYTYNLDNAAVQSLGAGQQTTDVITYTMADLDGATSTASLTVTITGTNDAPSVTTPPTQTVNEDESVSITGFSVADFDSSNLTVTLDAQSTVTLASTAGLVVSGDGTDHVTLSGGAADINAALDGLIYAPTANDSGQRGIDYSVSDGAASTSGTVAVDVTPDADAPDLEIGTPGGGGGDPTPMRISAGVHQYDMRDMYDNLSLGTLTFTQGDPSLPILPPIDPGFRFTVTTSEGFTYVASGQGFTYGPGNVPTGGTIMGLEIKDPGDPARPFLSLTNGGLSPDEFWAIPAADFVAAIGDYAGSAGADMAGLDAIFKDNVRWNLVGQDDGLDGVGHHHGDIFVGGDLNDTIAGADGADILFGGGGTDLLIGGADHNDVNWGGAGADWFQLAGTVGFHEDDVIADFSGHGIPGGDDDIIDLSAMAGVTSFEDHVLPHVSQFGPDTVIDMPLIKMTLLNYNAADLVAEDFVLFGQTNPLAATFNSSGGGGGGGSGNTASGNEDTPIALPAIAASLNDTDGSETLSISVANIPPGATLSDGAGGHSFTASMGNTTAAVAGWNLSSLSLLPPPNFSGTIMLGVEAKATDSATLSTGPATDVATTLGTIQVTVNPVNDPAFITGDVSGSVTEDGDTDANPATSQAATGNLDSTDPDGVNDSWQPVMAPTATASGHGTFTIDGSGNWTYNLNNGHAAVQALNDGQTLADNFTVSTTDGASQLVGITIHGVNDAPVAVADSNAGDAVVEAGVAGAGDASAGGNVLNNDTDPDAGDSKTVQGVAAGTPTGPLTGNVGATITGTYGTLNLAADGSYTYTLDNNDADTNGLSHNQLASDVFSYTMRDAAGLTSTATLTVAITGSNDAPSINVGPDQVVEAGETVTITGSFSDPDLLDTPTLVFDSFFPISTSIINGQFSADFVFGAPGTYSVAMTVADNHGATAPAIVSVQVLEPNNAPVANPDFAATLSNLPILIDVLANDTDATTSAG
jgi:VCBS repeat-containing protein